MPPQLFDHLWAKSPNSGQILGESVVAHSRYVLQNLLLLKRRSPDLHSICGMPRFWFRAAVAVSIHDLGKCTPGFQSMLRPGGKRFLFRHEVFSLCFLPWLFPEDPYGDLPWISATVASHHKDLDDIAGRYSAADAILGTPDALVQLQSELTPEFYQSAATLFAMSIWPALQKVTAGVSAPCVDAIQAGWNSNQQGIVHLRKALNAGLSLFQKLRRLPHRHADCVAGRFLRGAIFLSDHAGSAHHKLAVSSRLRSVNFSSDPLGLSATSMFPHQTAAAQATGSHILIAPTGSGKTEAALLWASSNAVASGRTPALFYVLPYQASMNAMLRRLQKTFGENMVGLQHSRTAQALYRFFLEKEETPQLARILAVKRAALARLHALPVRILSPYQILKGAFQVKGHEAIWTDAAGSLFIFDEIHAYEIDRLAMILATLRHLIQNLGATALFMSATLPDCLQTVLSEVLSCTSVIRASPDTYARFRRHRIVLRHNDLTSETIIQEILDRASQGLSVLVVATTVQRAQFIWSRLSSRASSPVQLLHGRFMSEHRFEKESKLLSQMSTSLGGGRVPCILVATQVVEVSLDVDFDTLFSDPAPLEALLQRFGRINRGRRHSLCDVHVTTAIPERSPVYRPEVITAALQALAPLDGQPLDESNVQAMLNEIYSGEFAADWLKQLRLGIANFETRVLSSLTPFTSDSELKADFDDLFDGYEVLPRSYQEEYNRRLENDPLRASSLLVSITRGQYISLKRRGLAAWVEHVCVVDVPYSVDTGLNLQPSAPDDGE